jgi:fluoroquinolone transport system permease protein
MKALNAIRALGPIDLKSIRRDSLLRWMVLFPLLIALLVRWGVPAVTRYSIEQFRFDLTPYYDLVMSLVLLMIPVMFGMIVGFLLLDQRDDRTLSALQVTPLGLNGYLVYRISAPVLLSGLITFAVFPLANLVSVAPLRLLFTALAAAPLAPLCALALAAFAENKVQGFALSKASGAVLLPPLLAYFIPSSWQLLFGLAPTYWPVKLFWAFQAGDPNAWIFLLAGLVYQLLLLGFLVRRFNRVMTR